MNSVEIRILKIGEEAVLRHVADGVFDEPVVEAWARQFLEDPRHHLAVAIEDGCIVGFASAVDHYHPDKSVQLWINEVGVAPAYHRRGIGRRLMEALFDRGRALGCRLAWVGTEPDNQAARGLYASLSGSAEPQPFVLYEFTL